MAESPQNGTKLPGLAVALGWVGLGVDEFGGAGVGRVHSVYADADSGEPAWLVLALGRRGKHRVAVPLRDCAAMDRVWTAQAREALRAAPVVDPTRPLLREHELAICAHYGTGETVGRAAEVAGRPAGSVTSQPAAG